MNELLIALTPLIVLLILAITAVAAYGFYASRGDEPLLGRAFLD